jgi:glycosyltransferase involved in cell wall biosynthesis
MIDSPAATARAAAHPLALPVRPRMLLLAQTLPFPPDGGVHIRIYNILKLLSLRYDVTLLSFVRRAERDAPESVADGIHGLAPYATVEAFPIPQEHSRVRWIWDHLRSLVSGRAYVWYAYESAAFRDRLTTLLAATPFDVVQIDSLDLACYLPALTPLPVVCVHHNVESTLMQRRADMERSRVRRWYLRLQARRLEQLERDWCERVALNVAVSDGDRDALEARAPRGRFATVPNGVDVEQFRPGRTVEEGIVSTGGLNWFPNADALTHFCDDILPRVRALLPTASVRWVGRADEAYAVQLWRDSQVELTGHVADIRPYVHQAACFVVPLRVGGGTRLKILDAWAMGKAVVSTAVGCEGLTATDGENILIRNDPAEFATAVATVLRDRGLRQRLGDAGRRTVEERYSWAVIGTGMRETLESVHQHPVAPLGASLSVSRAEFAR